MSVLTWPCQHCGKELSEVEYHLNTHYCYDCRKIKYRLKNQRNYDRKHPRPIYENCLLCGTPLQDPKTGKRRVKFCSNKCNHRYYWLTVIQPQRPSPIIKCKICGTRFKRNKSQVYCSVYCKGIGYTTKQKQRLIKVVAR